MISTAELAAMQATVQSAFDVLLTQKRNVPTQGPTKNVVDNYVTVGTVVGNLAQPTAGMLANYDYRVGDQASWLVRLPVGMDIRASDRLITPDGQVLDVQVVLAPRTYETGRQVIAAEVK